MKEGELERVLGTFSLWGIAVGLVISGEYFGWNFGWERAGTLGFLVATLFVALLYTTLIFGFAELASAIPKAGGPYAYATRAFGPTLGFLVGVATLVEFLFAPPAIALAIGSYLKLALPVDEKLVAVCVYLVFMSINALGAVLAASVELVTTLVAVFELLVFAGVTARGFSWTRFTENGWAHSSRFSSATFAGIFASLPFSIWFFLAIEGEAMAAEEVKTPEKTIPRAFLSGIATLVVLAFLVMVVAGGAGDWRLLARENSPLPLAMKAALGGEGRLFHMLVWIGLFGLLASFHGIVLGYSRQIFALARDGYLPRTLAHLSPRFKTPIFAIVSGGAFGIVVIYLDAFVGGAGLSLTASLVTMSVLGALVLYVVSMAALLRLRRSEPSLERPFRVPFYPLTPWIALSTSLVSLASVLYFNPTHALAFAIVVVAALFFARFRKES